MKIEEQSLPGVFLITPNVFGDHRGFFFESWNQKIFKEANLDFTFLQDNHSRSQKGVLRGLHYQVQHPQGKLVRVINGAIFDVAVDLRRSSPYFGKWIGVILSEENHQMLWIPPGFAHGFYVLSEKVDFLYKTTDFYEPTLERCIFWNDPDIAINWPIKNYSQPLLSIKDKNGSSLKNAEIYS